MSDPSPAQRVRNLCDNIHDALNLAEHPPAPRGGQSGATSGSRPPMPVAILDAKLDLKQKLTSWALMIGEEGGFVIDCDDDTLSIAAWVYTKADWLAQHPAFEDFTIEIDDCVKALRRPYASKDERRLVTLFDGAPIYAWPWEQTVRLPDGTVERTHTLRERLKGQTLDKVLAAPNVSAVLREIYDMDVPPDTIRKAGKRGNLTKHADGFRVGDVVERFATRTPRLACAQLSA